MVWAGPISGTLSSYPTRCPGNWLAGELCRDHLSVIKKPYPSPLANQRMGGVEGYRFKRILCDVTLA